jgi:homoserine dehydrogenase
MKVGVLGFGNVASATLRSFADNSDLILSKTDAVIEFVRVATRTPSRAAGRVPPGCAVTDDLRSVVDDPLIDVVIELTGDVDVGRELVLRALDNGKHVITANKALLARHGEEILRRADETDRCVLFEGAVAVSIPIIKTLKESAAANRLSSIVGILNGTSNYVLSQMSEHGIDFAAALAEAQAKGYAEADPTLDVSGEDAAHKIALLAALAFGMPIDFGAVTFKGIAEVDRVDIECAKRVGYQMKLIAQARRVDGRVSLGVEPTLVPAASMLAQVRGSMNGIAIQGDLLGSAFLYGSGAGGVQTASAVLADLLELANRTLAGRRDGPHNLGFKRGAAGHCSDGSIPQRQVPFYIRLRLDDKAGVLAKVSGVFALADVSVNALHQDVGHDGQAELIVITHEISASQLHDMLPSLQAAAGPGHSVVIYPVLDDCGC